MSNWLWNVVCLIVGFLVILCTPLTWLVKKIIQGLEGIESWLKKRGISNFQAIVIFVLVIAIIVIKIWG